MGYVVGGTVYCTWLCRLETLIKRRTIRIFWGYIRLEHLLFSTPSLSSWLPLGLCATAYPMHARIGIAGTVFHSDKYGVGFIENHVFRSRGLGYARPLLSDTDTVMKSQSRTFFLCFMFIVYLEPSLPLSMSLSSIHGNNCYMMITIQFR